MNQQQSQPQADLRWLITDDLHCLSDNCNYNIRGLIGPYVKCPECGHINNLKNPAPWKEASLPLGVKQREHWPALAPASSFITVFLLLIGLAMISDWAYQFHVSNYANFTLSLFALQVILPLILFLITLFIWLHLCVRWLRSANWSRRAFGLLSRTHIGAWCIFLGLILGPAQYAEGSTHKINTFLLILPYITLFPLGIFLIIWTSKTLKSASQTQITFREDWETWALPLNDEAEQSENQSADQPPQQPSTT